MITSALRSYHLKEIICIATTVSKAVDRKIMDDLISKGLFQIVTKVMFSIPFHLGSVTTNVVDQKMWLMQA